MYPNGYYNYLKCRKSGTTERSEKIKKAILSIYHKHRGVYGYRITRKLLEKEGIAISAGTCRKYMNIELGLKSVARRRKPAYRRGNPHRLFPNLLKQDFCADKPNEKWCSDFTYLPISDGSMRYNCTIIDLYDRSVVASVTGNEMSSSLAIKALSKGIANNRIAKGQLILHSDQGSQFTSKEFVSFCERHSISQSMSKAGCPYDNAPMERYFNTLKNEYFNLFSFKDEKTLYDSIEWFSYIWYNHGRPHSANGYLTPFEARYK